jgi:hypothetical protein
VGPDDFAVRNIRIMRLLGHPAAEQIPLHVQAKGAAKTGDVP